MKNIQIQSLVSELKKKSIEEKVAIWKRVAIDLEKPSRNRRIVNLNKLSKFTKEGDVIVVPGKVLGDGDFNKKVTIAAYQFSTSAMQKLATSKSKIMKINELMSKFPKGKNIRIIG